MFTDDERTRKQREDQELVSLAEVEVTRNKMKATILTGMKGMERSVLRGITVHYSVGGRRRSLQRVSVVLMDRPVEEEETTIGLNLLNNLLDLPLLSTHLGTLPSLTHLRTNPYLLQPRTCSRINLNQLRTFFPPRSLLVLLESVRLVSCNNNHNLINRRLNRSVLIRNTRVSNRGSCNKSWTTDDRAS